MFAVGVVAIVTWLLGCVLVVVVGTAVVVVRCAVVVLGLGLLNWFVVAVWTAAVVVGVVFELSRLLFAVG